MTIDRRELIALAAAGGAVAALPARAAPFPPVFNPDRLAADVARYADFGHHQTGSPGDRATGVWVRERLTAAGFAVATMPVEVPFFDSRAALLRVGALTIIGFAQHPVTPTGPQGITAPLRVRYDAADDAGLAGAIALIPLPYARHVSVASPMIGPALVAAKRAGAVAAVLITTGPSGLAIALNAPEHPAFAPLPVLSIGIDQAPALIARARAGGAATLVIDGISGRRQGENIVARRPGLGPNVVVTTPLSGWFQCAGERGSGIAAWLACAAWLPRAFPHHDLTFAGLVGHERENAGSRLFIDHAAPPPNAVALWQHIGACFATRDAHEASPGRLTLLATADSQRYLIASPPLVPAMAAATRGLPGFEHVYRGDASTAAGEATAIIAAGYPRVIANYGAHRFFHTDGDGVEATSGELIAATVNAVLQGVTTIPRGA